jgi:hypothetical protein
MNGDGVCTAALGIGAAVGLVSLAVLLGVSSRAEKPSAEEAPAMRVDHVSTLAGEPMKVIHDDANGVTCWWLGGGMSCLPNGSFGGAK